MGGRKGPGRPGRLMSARVIQEELGVKENAAWRVIRALPCEVKIGRSVYVFRGDVERFLEENTVAHR
ncbi:MAG: hypothetical protein OXG37_09795 [Actinomycetia bacterium]|nr:hypothetical protein [Actinomycetes bacterium]